ncbi:UTP-glucose-1-phosphate uridylyltransferase [Pholiota conissans]|uniref:UTP--glucose-1-phosphate uridylyltransferase n=1 Tax=Pholiota conissans TaxID=109636 RepID=A0A9P5YRK9_9AGAR|nr:UTP-glucose-1-phosphate uridylyltransferase [Pholiota conissans]
MPLFKRPFRNFRRRSRKYFPERTENDKTNGISAQLNDLVASIPNATSRKLFFAEMQSFIALYNRHLSDMLQGQQLEWDKVAIPADGQIISYERLADKGTAGLQKLAVLKVNGGLGTTMGLNGAKSALEVQDNLTFLDLVVQQIEHLNTTERVDVPLLLMTSFNTEEDTLRIVKNYANRPVKITTFNQSRYPRILKESTSLLAKDVQESKSAWYPPGHGDLFNALQRSGVLDRLLSEGKQYLFVSNSDNLGAVVDKRILQYMIERESEFIMEVTNKTRVDMKGGTLINYEGSLRLLETAQVPPQCMEEFHSGRKFKVFNTNNLWIDLKAVKRVFQSESLQLDIISNSKQMDDGRTVIQLETAAGSAIKHFERACGVRVPRSRFLPVKNCSDLLLVKSDLYVLEHGSLRMNRNRMFDIPPVIKLGEHFRKINQFQKRFKQIPHILDLDHLTVAGDVHFGRNVTLRGTVIIVANEDQRIDIPDGCTLENRMVSGNLNMIEL